MTAIRTFATAAAVAAALTFSAVQDASAAFKSGIWTGDAYISKEGQFQRCAIVGEYEGDTDLGFGLAANGAYEVYLINKTWTLEPGQAAKVSIKIDNLPEVSGAFQVVSKDTLGTVLQDRPELVQAFKAGSVATISGFFGTLKFPLKGTSKAFAVMEDCVRQVKSGMQDGKKVAEAREKVAKVRGQDLFKLAPQPFAWRVLKDLPQDQFAIPKDVDQAMKRWNAALVWRIDRGLGLVQSVGGNHSEEELRAELVKLKAPSCKAQLTSEADLRLLPGTQTVLPHVELSCSDVGNGTAAYEVLTFFPHASGNMIAVSHIGETLDAARLADNSFLNQVAVIAAQ
ncbi:hypothetical protein T8K17_14825 [Thalassobaculum sp. OXR-137]|uniref:hypothetical protein n=1 Tax=Thalassobaculum sp. OXR-137 TaxID=3100173 RepID=UPI002AC90A89|nr:hypothetical protein [Thalassobaculum sp. OXR-137]WPZ32514.1 hypothetical protein T8K17_14825 [Thalassobaculum sp. OXR-137]